MADTPEESRSAVYEHICQESSPWEPPIHLEKVPSSTGIYCGVANAGRLLKSLGERFSPNQLCAARVVREAAGSLQLHPGLVGEGRIWIAISTNVDLCYDLIVDSGCISQRGLPLLALARDSRFIAGVHKMRPVMITCSVLDMAGYRYLGIPATTAIGLDRLKKSTFASFRRLLGQDYSVPSGDDDSCTITQQLIFSTWSPVSRRTADPKIFQSTISHFEDLQEHLGIRLDRVLFWDPSEDSQRRIAFAMEHGERDDIRHAIIEAATSESTRLRQPPERPGPQLQTPAELLRGLSHWQGGNPYAWDDANAQMVKYIGSRLIEPLLAEADANPDPIERNLLTILAGLCQQAHSHLLATMVRRSKAEHSQEPTAGSHVDFCDDLSQLPCLIDQILRVSKQLRSPDSVPRFPLPRIKSRFRIRS
jgi:hypothetical protein